MQLYRRNKKYYYVKYFDENECEVRVSTGKKRKDEGSFDRCYTERRHDFSTPTIRI